TPGFWLWHNKTLVLDLSHLYVCFFFLFPRFHINLNAGEDIALHINPRRQEQTVVRNSFLNGRWGPEERELPFNPFQPGQYFEVLWIVHNFGYQVMNRNTLCNYNHRIPPQNIRVISIDGNLELQSLSVMGGQVKVSI
uniref:Galectin n=1 Tax=Pseudonaja textilis TaxID=8673 RepID=A0A670Z1S5_PSETE